jgi:hypothetical protein
MGKVRLLAGTAAGPRGCGAVWPTIRDMAERVDLRTAGRRLTDRRRRMPVRGRDSQIGGAKGGANARRCLAVPGRLKPQFAQLDLVSGHT